MKIVRYILFPIVPIYFLVTWLRNKFYDHGIFKSSQYNIPSICVGNLSVGGTGKTPMIECLIRLFKDDFKIATLSRGYKRSSEGFIIADDAAMASSIGDEPYQFYNKFEDIIVSVDADRRHGISSLLELENPPEMILLDDAFQHRKVKAKFSILLTSHDHLYVNDMLLPTGNLREPKSGAKRADVIVITKCSESITENDKNRIIKSIKPQTYQSVFFSWIAYSQVMKNSLGEQPLNYFENKNVTLVTGIANPTPLVIYLEKKNFNFEHLKFNDHHEFTAHEIEMLKMKEFILTTEKDFMRLSSHFEGKENIYYLPIELKIDKPKEFNKLMKKTFK